MPPAWPLRLTLLKDVAEGMRYLCETIAAIHRDLKSQNVLLQWDDVGAQGTSSKGKLRAKVADFGLSKSIGKLDFNDTPRHSSQDIQSGVSRVRKRMESLCGLGGGGDGQGATCKNPLNATNALETTAMSTEKEGTITSPASSPQGMESEHLELSMTAGLGTPNWMAPELCRIYLDKSSQATYSQAVDTYAYGIIMWEAVQLRAPFSGPRWPARFQGRIIRHVAAGGRPADVSNEDRAAAPAGFCELMDACSAQSPSERPDFSHVFATLEALCAPNSGKVGRDSTTAGETAIHESTNATSALAAATPTDLMPGTFEAK